MKEGWVTDAISNLCNVEYGTRVVRKRDAGSVYPVYGGGGATFSMDTFNREDRMVVGRFAMSEKCTRFVKGKFFLNDSGLTLSTKKHELMNDEFLNYQVLSLNDTIYSIGRGTAQKNLNVDEFKKLNLSFPNSLEEQKEIVSILDDAFRSIDKAKANIEKNIENSKELFQSKLNKIFSQTGEGWDKKTLGELGKVCMCKRIMKHQTSPEGDIPFYKIGTFGKSPNAFIDNETYISFKEKYSFPKVGDILISASGTIGRRVIYDGEPAYFQDSNIVWIDNNEDLVSNDYLYHFYGVCNWNPSKGATISRLYNADLRRIEISFPNIKTQKLLVEKMVALQNNFEAIQLSYEVKLKNLTELKKSILQKAFSGELTNKSVAA